MPTPIVAALWGLITGSALLLGGAVGYYARLSERTIALITAFGAGVLISALAFDLMDDAYQTGGFAAAAAGFLVGAFIYTAANVILARSGARDRKRSGTEDSPESSQGGADDSATAIFIGSLIDGIPESIAIGLSIIAGGAVSVVTVIAIFLSNIPEGLSSSAGMRRAGRTPRYVFGLWGTAMALCTLASFLGYTLFSLFDPHVIAFTTALAGGAILAMLADTMMPEAFENAHDAAGLVTAVGFLFAFMLTKLEGG